MAEIISTLPPKSTLSQTDLFLIVDEDVVPAVTKVVTIASFIQANMIQAITMAIIFGM